jgi:hypothetical protein
VSAESCEVCGSRERLSYCAKAADTEGTRIRCAEHAGEFQAKPLRTLAEVLSWKWEVLWEKS